MRLVIFLTALLWALPAQAQLVDSSRLDAKIQQLEQGLSDLKSRVDALHPIVVEPLPPADPSTALDECVARLIQPGWCELGQSISTVWPADPTRQWHGVEGPPAILVSWNGMAFDRSTAYILAGGGHAAYLGNGSLAFRLDTVQWETLRPPCPLDTEIVRGQEPYGTISGPRTMGPNPECGPSSSHTYDGTIFSRRSGTILWMSGIYGASDVTWYSGRELWEFNPSPTDTRLGLAPLTWRMLPWKLADRGFPRSFETPNGDIYFGGNTKIFRLDREAGFVPAGYITKGGDDHGAGVAIWDEARQLVWNIANSGRLFSAPLGAHWSEVADHGERPIGAGDGDGAALRNGRIVTWDGKGLIHEYDPDTDVWREWDWTGQRPGIGHIRPYSKWVYLPQRDVFLGISYHDTAPLLYRHPDSGGTVVPKPSSAPAQSYIDADQPIPPGIYRRGIRIARGGTYDLNGVRFAGTTASKGFVVVETSEPVVILNYTQTDPPDCFSCAALRITAPNFNVTMRTFDLRNQIHGVLTDNRGGTLLLEDGLIDGTITGFDWPHGIYIGKIDRATLKNVIIRNVNGKGHILKSRADVTELENVTLDGGTSNHSRVVDLPCGGTFVAVGGSWTQSRKADNAEFLAIGTEPGNCGPNGVLPGSVSLSNMTIIGRKPGATLIQWRPEAGPVNVMKDETVILEGVVE